VQLLGVTKKRRTVPDPGAVPEQAGRTILLQQHAEYDIDALVERACFLFDTRGVAQDGEKVQRL